MNIRKILIAAAFLSASLVMSAKVTLPGIIGDNMVLQQKSKAGIWGWTKPGTQVRVNSSWGASASAKTDVDGKWKVLLDTPEASFEKRTITISDGDRLTLRNILIGEVWLCSGQSNMWMTVEGGHDCFVENSQRIIVESAHYPDVRLFNVGLNGGFEKKEDVNGTWDEAGPKTVRTFSAIGYLFGRDLQQALNVPVGVINSSCGGTWIEAWFPAELQKGYADYDPASYRKSTAGYEALEVLYNGMIWPLRDYSIKGFLWYQGCTNIGGSSCYAEKMVGLINHWRDLWGGGRKPFYYVELAPHDSGDDNLGTAIVREQQAKVMDMIDNVGMVSTNDLVYEYELWNIHPQRKEPIAERLCWWALSRDYGYGDAIKVIGPRYKSMDVQPNGEVKIEFTGSECGFIIDGEIDGFEIAGSNKEFKPAKAVRRRTDPSALYVSCYDVGEPMYVRYNFKNNAIGHLWDSFGQPVIPFRTDTFEIK